MSEDRKPDRYRAVPSSRLSRLSGFGKLAGGVAGGMLAEGARKFAAGERPSLQELALTPGNAQRLTNQLSQLRGAAMKLGQMISLDAGDLLPPELSAILATLRDQANFMPPRQLDKVLAEEWGKDWRRQFLRFEPHPIAAASIGQVHRALTRDGDELAIKVQYPGVRDSIDADIDNVASLLRLSGLLPKELDIAPLLAAAKEQLHEEANYLREGEQMRLYAERLAGERGFVVPRLYPDMTTRQVLVMSYEAGEPIENLETQSQDVIDEVFGRLLSLVARELFEFRVMQTDPNFANFRFRADTQDIVLLDFGATRPVEPRLSGAYRAMLTHGFAGEREKAVAAAVDSGFVNRVVLERHPDRVERMTDVIMAELTRKEPFDFGDRAFVAVLRDEGMAIARDKASWHLPPPEAVFVQRKVSGTALLGARLKAVVDVRGRVGKVLTDSPPVTLTPAQD
ncbi:AarF/ABC1/UbiB kinase family protein [Alteriqipengyuania flavescens]|uniref:ABC1 kinase family protein n=1 Tax=Alteriqipengyuania flavescens TaxID=3053610 RepID=UPI0025B2C6B1|nr:AarF/ABC1/UbiB kinase family protein [Alteriqipengyuania flavescens]WJY18441.1 AarF/ABC1/UbiB kinase family protein [Alteriqipengyuania flavescens]WJY24382.1 AarF/ABC1/UbiB kinase family protein [Alteriqipengyuania flavescens]